MVVSAWAAPCAAKAITTAATTATRPRRTIGEPRLRRSHGDGALIRFPPRAGLEVHSAMRHALTVHRRYGTTGKRGHGHDKPARELLGREGRGVVRPGSPAAERERIVLAV